MSHDYDEDGRVLCPDCGCKTTTGELDGGLTVECSICDWWVPLRLAPSVEARRHARANGERVVIRGDDPPRPIIDLRPTQREEF